MTKRKLRTPPPTARPDKPPQTIRGGYIVVRRDVRTSRLLTRHGTAYEHGSAAEARAQAAILAERFGCEFAVFREIDAVQAVAQPENVVNASDSGASVDAVQGPQPSRRRGTLTLPRGAAPT